MPRASYATRWALYDSTRSDYGLFHDGSRPPLSKWGRDFVPQSFHFLCPVCGTVWATCIIQDKRTQHSAIHRECIIHGNGRLTLIWEDGHNDGLPPALLAREVEIEAEDAEKRGVIESISPPSFTIHSCSVDDAIVFTKEPAHHDTY